MKLRILPDSIVAPLMGIGFIVGAVVAVQFNLGYPWGPIVVAAGLLLPMAFWDNL